MSDYLDPNNEELLKDFFMEAEMQVDLLEQNILALENNPRDKDAVDEIFRAAHTLKGGAATVQMVQLSEFTHLVEDVLDEIRSDHLSIDDKVTDVLLISIDIIKEMLSAKNNGVNYERDDKKTIEALASFLPENSLSLKKINTVSDVKQVRPARKIEEKESSLSYNETGELLEAAPDDYDVFEVLVHFNENNPMNTVGGIQVYAILKSVSQILKTNPDFEALYEDVFYPEVSYFIATQQTREYLQARMNIQDVINSVEIMDVKRDAEEEADFSDPSPVSRTTEAVPTRSVPETAVPVEAATHSREEITQELEKTEQTAATPKSAEKNHKKKSGSILRVDSKRIDNLLNLVSEAVINKATFNQISTEFTDNMTGLQTTEIQMKESLKSLFDSLPAYLSEIQEGKSVKEVKKEINEQYGELFNLFDKVETGLKVTVNKFKTTAQNLGRTIGDLHEGVLRIRMVPISQIFSRFPRLVRDLSRSLHKNIQLDIEGEDTELDKSVIEDLLDPLIHCVRNSLDHGIESPEVREAAGKPKTGHVLLKASNEGNIIRIEISDDGAGIDVESVRKKAISRGIIHPSKQLSDLEAFNLIFEPGFSTAHNVTNISGRGVGLDVVKRQIEKLNGNVSVWSQKGSGTSFTIKLPLTLAIIQGLLVQVGRETYAIPITSVIESHRIKPSEIKMIDNHEVFNVREDVISLLRLNNLFRIESREEREYCFIVVVGSGDKKMGLMVDSLIGEEDVVIKPLRDHYTNSPGIAGATILGDGTVSLIIDVSQLLDLGMQKEMAERTKRQSIV